MKKMLFLLMLVFLSAPQVWSQSKKATPPPPPKPAPPRIPPPQYVSKKDFEAKMGDIEAKARAAQNAAGSARNALSAVQDSVSYMGSKIGEIENVLNSANIQLTLNADSIKSTRTEIAEIRLDHEKRYAEMQAKNDEQSMLIYILMTLCIVLPLGVLGLTLPKFKKLHLEIRNQAERTSSDVQKNYISIQDEMKSLKNSVQGEAYNIKIELTNKLNQEKDLLQRGMKDLDAKLAAKMDKPVDENEDAV